MVEKLPIIKEIVNSSQFPEEFRKHSLALMLNGFFEDFESAVYTKMRIEKKIRKK